MTSFCNLIIIIVIIVIMIIIIIIIIKEIHIALFTIKVQKRLTIDKIL